MPALIPPIVKASERLVVDIEEAVRCFPNYHRHQIGKDLRKQAMTVYELTDRAWRDRANQAQSVVQLVWEIDRLRTRLQVAQLIRATASFRQFEHLARAVKSLGKQAGGWRKHLQQHPKGQNAQGQTAVAQRAQILSTRAASAGANQ